MAVERDQFDSNPCAEIPLTGYEPPVRPRNSNYELKTYSLGIGSSPLATAQFTISICQRCGSLVDNRQTHDHWHATMSKGPLA